MNLLKTFNKSKACSAATSCDSTQDADDFLEINHQDAPKLDVYCERTTHSATVQGCDPKKLIEHGKLVLENILRSSNPRALAESHLKKPGLIEQNVAGFVWLLMNEALQQNEDFVEGTFMVSDPHGKVSQYFLGAGYGRLSSHIPEISKFAVGVDIGVSWQSYLPAGHTHVLVQAIDHKTGPRLLIKPEAHGVRKFKDVLLHGLGWCQSMLRRCMPHLFGSNQKDGYRKERLPPKLKTAYKKLCTNLKNSGAIPQIPDTKWGISAMYKFTKDVLQNNPKITSEQRLELEKLLKTFEQYSHLEVRCGEEVILDLTQIARN